MDLDGEELPPEEDEYDDSLAGEIRRQLKSAPWYLTSAAIHMVALLLLMLIPTMPPERQRESIVLTTEVLDEPEEEEEKEEEPEPEPEEDPLEAVMEETDVVAPPTEVVTETEVDTQVQIDTEIEEVVVDEVVGDPSEEEVADASEDAAPNLMGVQGSAFSNKAGLSAGFRGGFGKIGRGIRGMVRGGGGGGGKGLCLVWLLDQSGSMKDDQEAVAAQARDIQELLTDGGRKKMFSAVVSYGATWQVTQPLTKESSRITDAILNVQIDKSGTENTCHAISYICQDIMAQKRGWTKIIVLLSDESSSDDTAQFSGDNHENSFSVGGRDRRLPMLEVALKSLVETKTRLFVIGKESPFQSTFVREPYVDETGHRWLLDAKRGPESPMIEVPIINSTLSGSDGHNRNAFTGEIKAGFGVYDLAYLAGGSRGAYFILDESAGARRPMSRSERMRNPFVIDWEIMDLYKPDVVSRFQYKEVLFKQGKQGRKIWQLNDFFRSTGNIQRRSRCAPNPNAVAGNANMLSRRQGLLLKLVEVIGDARATDEEVFAAENKRQMANIDLYYAVLLADQMITDAWLGAYQSYNGPWGEELEPGWGHHLQVHAKPNASLSEEERILFQDRMRQFTKACNEVIRRHPNTTWAQCANWMQGGPARYGRPHELRYHKYKHGKGRPRPRM